VTCLDRSSVVGGNSILALSKDGPCLQEETLSPGQVVVFDDKMYWHEVQNIQPRVGCDEGHRDALVLTFTTRFITTSRRTAVLVKGALAAATLAILAAAVFGSTGVQ